MKKIICFILSMTILTVCMPVGAVEVVVNKRDYTFANERYSISELDTDGNIFVGIKAGRVAVSQDFENWTVREALGRVDTVLYLNGQFLAVSAGTTLVSADGETWTRVGNSLTAPIAADSLVKNNGSAVAYCVQNNEKTMVQSYDGIHWKRVEDIPQGIPVYVVNGLFMFESHGYMRGIYYSENGETFNRSEVEGYHESYGPMNVRYYDGLYHIEDYWAAVEDEIYHIHRFSEDLIHWRSELAIRDADLSKANSHYITLNGELHCLTGNGADLVRRNGEWVNHFSFEDANLLPFVYYRLTDQGVLAWSTDLNCYFISEQGVLKTYHGSEKRLLFTGVRNDYFYAVSTDGVTAWVSQDAQNWVRSEEKFEYGALYNSASNGNATLTAEFHEWGSREGYEGNFNTKARLEKSDGTGYDIIYENAKNDTVTVFGGNGYFILGGFSDFKYYISRDGITRYELNFGEEAPFGRLLMNSSVLTYRAWDGTNHIADVEQFEKLTLPGAVTVLWQGKALSFSTASVVVEDRTLVPVRFLFENMGAEVLWNQDEKKVTITKDGLTLICAVDQHTAWVNGEEKVLDVPAKLIDNKTMIPLRFIAEELGFKVDWEQGSRLVDIN